MGEFALTRLKISGRIPSKKNSRVSTRSGRTFPSKRYVEWHKDATAQVVEQGIPLIDNVSEVVLRFYMPDNRRCDLTNKAESVMDLLVDCGVIEDDCWQVIPRLILEVNGVYKCAPGVDIWLLHKSTE